MDFVYDVHICSAAESGVAQGRTLEGYTAKWMLST